MRIVLDAFGSDNAPFPEVEGAVLAIKEEICEKILLVGKEDVLNNELDKYIYDRDKIEVINATEVISMHDSPAQMVKKKKDSSLVKAVKLHKEGLADGFVSVGNTGAVMTASLLTLGRIKNVLRPAIAIALPTVKDPAIILDVGANVDCNPTNLLQFAEMGNLYSHFFFNIDKPQIALLNIGEESSKGNDLVKKVYPLLENNENLNFIGNIEGKDVLQGTADVIVCDGFVGNVILKTIEGAALAILGMLKEQIKKDWVAKIGALLSFPAYSYLKKKLDHTEYGGALLVGLNGIAVVGHGRSNGVAVKNAIKAAANIAKSGFIQHAKEYYEGKKYDS